MNSTLEVPSESLVTIPDAALAVAHAESLIAERRYTPEWQAINGWEKMAAELPQQLCPLDHVFTPGLYTRIIFMPAGTKLTSKIHLFEHPYIIASGVVSVWTLEAGWVTLRAPHVGVTKPATRRLLHVREDCIWITSHVTNETDPEKIVDAITFDHMKLGHMGEVSAERMAAIRENQLGKHP